MILVSALPRIIGAFLLPNAFGDAYAYYEAIEGMRAKMAVGEFGIRHLYGFWLPLYQFFCALLSLIFGHAFYLAKLVSALCGAGVCLLVYSITLRLTSDRRLALISFALVALSPLHVLYSSSSLTDIPHALLVLACVRFILAGRWQMAAIFAAAAALVRLESWMLIALLPALQYFRHRTFSWRPLALTLISPLLWLYVCWLATGDPLSYFEDRKRYVVEYTAANPAVATFTRERLQLDAMRLFASTSYVVLAGCFVALATVWKRARRQGGMETLRAHFGVIATDALFFSNLGFLLLAYLTGNQPDIWSRYGLILYALGMPVLAWTYQAMVSGERRSGQALPATVRGATIKGATIKGATIKAAMIQAVMIVAFLHLGMAQMEEAAGCVSDESARMEIASLLKEARQNDPDLRLYCEDGNVRFLSGIEPERFVRISQRHTEREELLKELRDGRVRYVISTSWERTALTRLFPGLREGSEEGAFEPIASARSRSTSLVFWVYRIRYY